MRKQNYFTKTVNNFNEVGNYAQAAYVCNFTDVIQIYNRLSGKDDSVIEIPDEDYYNIFVGVNIWCNLFSEVTRNAPDMLLQRIKLIGLQDAIREADNHRLYLISQGSRGACSNFWNQWFSVTELSNRYLQDQLDPWLKHALSVLGCIRKIRITCLDYSFMYDEFLETNRKCGTFNRAPWIDYGIASESEAEYWKRRGSFIPTFWTNNRNDWEKDHPFAGSRLLDDLASIIAIIFDSYEKDDNLFTLPPGASYEGAHTYLEKFKIVEQQQEWLRNQGINIPITGIPDPNAEPADCSRYIIVPKSYKTGRGVAPEPVSRQVLGYQISSGMRKCLRKIGIDLRDQSRNQALCAVANKEKLATVDKSSASDLISYELVVQLFKYVPKLLHQLKNCRSKYVQLRGKKYVSRRFFTMGNAATFDTETAIFLAIAIYVGFWQDTDFESFYTSKNTLRKKGKTYQIEFSADELKEFIRKKLISVYGDDVIIPEHWYESYCSIAEKLGFSINHEKSYSSGFLYRESCGVEYFGNINVTGIYYPRGISRKALPELLGLQHKYVDFPSVDYFLTSIILDVFPEMTTSEVPDDRSQGAFDIWTQFPNRIIGNGSPYGEYLTICRVRWLEKQKQIRLKTKDLSLVKKEGYFLSQGVNRNWGILKAISLVENPDYVPASAILVSEYTKLVDVESSPCSEDTLGSLGDVHAVLTSSSTGIIPLEEAERVERLMYLLTIGNGLEHINSSDYTSNENMIRSRHDLVSDRKIQVTFKTIV